MSDKTTFDLERDKIKGFITHPKKQLKYAFIVGAFVGFGIVATNGLVMVNLQDSIRQTSSDEYISEVLLIQVTSLLNSMSIIVFTFGFNLAFIATLYITNRFFGPIISIRRYLDDLIKGDYSRRLKLRKSDELHDIVEKINELANMLEKKTK